MNQLPIALVIITLNEANNIRRCIESASFCKEVIVVDSLSQDETVKIANSLGAKTHLRPFLGYRDQKQWAMNQASQPWVLSLDADEALSPELSAEIIRRFENTGAGGFRMPRLSFHLNRWIRHGGWYPDYQTRLFKKSSARWVGGDVHESVSVTGPVETLQSNLLHYVFKDLSDQIETNNNYSTKGAQNLIKKGEQFSLLKMIFKPLGKFLECYFWKQGFRDGAPGFIIALAASQSLFLKYAKLWEHSLKRSL